MPHKFRELMVWQRAMDLITHVYLLSRQFPQDELFGLTSQLRRAATSIALNIAEGAGGSSVNDFKRFLDIALKSTYETMTALEIGVRLGYYNDKDVQPLLDETDQKAAMIVVLSKRLQERPEWKTIRELAANYDVDPASDY